MGVRVVRPAKVAKVRVVGMPRTLRACRHPRTRCRRSPGAAGSNRTPATDPLCAIWTPTAPKRRAVAVMAANSGWFRTCCPRRALAVATLPRSRTSPVSIARRSRARSRSNSWRSASVTSRTGRVRVSTGSPPPRVQPTTTSGGRAGPSTSRIRPSRWAKRTGRASSISGSLARSARTASRATVSGARRSPYESATARTVAMTSLVELPMPRPTGTSPASLNSPPQGGSPARRAHSTLARVAACAAFVRSAGTTVSASAGVPGRRRNSARLPGPAMGRVTRPAHRRPAASRKTPWRSSPWWQGACPVPVVHRASGSAWPPGAGRGVASGVGCAAGVMRRPPRGSGRAPSRRR